MSAGSVASATGVLMQLGSPARPGPIPHDVATAIRDAATRLGHRPAITQLSPAGRQEQSVASLAQWAAKGANFLELELGLAPGARIALRGPLGWSTAAVALAAWWAGVGVRVDGRDGDVGVVVCSLGRAPTPLPDATASGMDTFWLGDGIDGAPDPASTGTGEPWTHAVQPFPDQPPPPRATAEAAAVVDGDRVTSQAELLRLASPDQAPRPLGLDRTHGADGADSEGHDATLDLAWLCLRPLLSGRPTVVVRDVERRVADAERVGSWH